MAEKKVRMFKVIALSVGGRGNKIFESGQTISENHLPSNTADSLVKSKHIEEVDSINEDESNFVPSDPEIIIGTEKNEDEVGEVDSINEDESNFVPSDPEIIIGTEKNEDEVGEVDSINEDESNFVPSDPEIIIGTEKNEDEVGEVDSINEDESNFVPSDPEIIIGTEKNEDEVGEVDSEKNNVIKSEDEVETISHKATEEDLKNNPELVAAGIKIGDTIQIPKNDIVAGKVDELPEGTFKVFIDKDNNPREVKSIDDITKPELIFALNKESVEFSATSNKKDLYTLWINLK